ncbi:MAG: SUMF1/EgtB/PvdO family nonheme iron enzyme, partial [Blastocatellia bacterium]
MSCLFDVFLSHNSKDKEFVRTIAGLLRKQGLNPWLDEEQLVAGKPWQPELIEGLNASKTCAVFIGLHNMGNWETEEVSAALIKAADSKEYRLIPVILPGIEDPFSDNRLSLFLKTRTWVDCRPGLEDQWVLHTLISAIKGDPSGPKPQQTNGVTRREKEMAHLRRLQKEQGEDLDKYTPLAGNATERSVIKPVYDHLPFKKLDMGKKFARPVEARRFEDAVGEILKLKRAVVLGEPGAGKTTTLWKLAGELIDQALASETVPLPLFIRLGKWTEEKKPFRNFLAEQLGDFADQLDRLLQEKRAVLLLDGLNELPAGQRKEKTAEIRRWIDQWPEVTAIISCRQLDYTENDLEMDRVEIVPLDPLRIRQFVVGYLGDEKGGKLFWRLAGEKAQETHQRFLDRFKDELPDLERIFWCDPALPTGLSWGWGKEDNRLWDSWIHQREHPSSLMVMARNPFMLMMLYSVYDEQSETLPGNRGRLFETFAETLFQRERIEGEPQQKLADGISRVAYWMQTRRTAQKQGDALTVLPRAEVLEKLAEDQLHVAIRASLLSPGEEVRFTHQLLQEYFAARHLDREIRASGLQATTLWPPNSWWERNNWEETAVLLAGLSSDDCTPVIDWIADANPEVAAMCLDRSGAICPPETLARLQQKWLPRLTGPKREKDPRARAAVGRALGMARLDDRPGVGTIVDSRGRALPNIDWGEIPAGRFVYGDESEYAAKPEEVELPTFFISRYPVTFGQFQLFLDDPEGIRDPRWLKGLAGDAREHQPGEQAFPFDNHPRERVSWYQAIAFCRWLSWRLGGEYDLKKIAQWAVRLPTEYEWEKAARGTDGRIYPYLGEFDPTKGNTEKTGIGQTSAVGIFPEGASPFGVMDLSGNVWEWCLNE